MSEKSEKGQPPEGFDIVEFSNNICPRCNQRGRIFILKEVVDDSPQVVTVCFPCKTYSKPRRAFYAKAGEHASHSTLKTAINSALANQIIGRLSMIDNTKVLLKIIETLKSELEETEEE